jgi:signal peptidase II
MKKYLPYLILVIFLVVLDQYSKFLVVENFRLYEKLPIIPGFLDFTHTRNTGIAFSMGGDMSVLARTILFKILPIGICIWIIREFFKEFEKSKMMAISYTLILAGAIGNLIDRIRLDYVVDFIAVYSNGIGIMPPWRFAIFNIADSAVSVGAFFLILHMVLAKKKEAAAD